MDRDELSKNNIDESDEYGCYGDNLTEDENAEDEEWEM